jgi:rRNA maturation RNase YbeY
MPEADFPSSPQPSESIQPTPSMPANASASIAPITTSTKDENDAAFDSTHATSLSLDGLNLELFYDPALSETQTGWTNRLQQLEQRIQALWPHFVTIAKTEGVFETLGVDFDRHTLEVELTWVGNPLMHRLNRDFRQKDAPTDVLTFTLLADSSDPGLWLSLPVLQMGSIFISIDWADNACRENPTQSVDAYLLERFIHGLLHLHGFHHDTMPQYHRVVAIQQKVLAATFGD